MKILKYLLYVIGALILIVIILGLVGPKSYDASRSTVINAKPVQVWPYVSSLKELSDWGPWMDLDTTLEIEYSNVDGVVGSTSSWTGSSGKGKQTLTVLDRYKAVETELIFYASWGESKSTGYFNLVDTSGGTKVTWGIKGENNFIGRIFGIFMNFDKIVGKDFEKGLVNLKTKVEANVSAAPKPYRIDQGNFPGAKYLGVRKKISVDELPAFYAMNLSSIVAELELAKAKADGFPSGLFYSWDLENGTTDMAAAISFRGDIKIPKGMQIINLPPSKYITLDYYGDYKGLKRAYDALDAYVKDQKLVTVPPVLDAYVTDPGAEPDTAKWLTKVVYFIK